MTHAPELLLIAAVAAVGVLHTIVPDHWVPITLIARQQGWSKGETARVAAQAGTGHVVSTLLIGLVVWIAGVAFATRFGTIVSTASSIALVAFGCWIAISALREMRGGPEHHHHDHHHEREWARSAPDRHDHDHDHDEDAPFAGHAHGVAQTNGGGTAVLTRHAHAHRHGDAAAHDHAHEHDTATWHPVDARVGSDPPHHEHTHKRSTRTALLLILGSSPMVEGIPAFFAASRYGVGLIAVMAVVFAIATIATYVALCVFATAGLKQLRFGAFEKYGEVVSGAFIAVVGVVFFFWPLA